MTSQSCLQNQLERNCDWLAESLRPVLCDSQEKAPSWFEYKFMTCDCVFHERLSGASSIAPLSIIVLVLCHISSWENPRTSLTQAKLCSSEIRYREFIRASKRITNISNTSMFTGNSISHWLIMIFGRDIVAIIHISFTLSDLGHLCFAENYSSHQLYGVNRFADSYLLVLIKNSCFPLFKATQARLLELEVVLAYTTRTAAAVTMVQSTPTRISTQAMSEDQPEATQATSHSLRPTNFRTLSNSTLINYLQSMLSMDESFKLFVFLNSVFCFITE